MGRNCPAKKFTKHQSKTMKYTPENSAVAAQLAAHYRIMGGWDNSQAIETNDSNALAR
jgi:hypothetical protein